MANVKIDFTKNVGEIKPLHGVGQPPMAGRNFSRFHYLTEANIPYSRLHDVGGAFGGGSPRRAGPQRGDDVLARVTLTFEEAAFGCKKDVNYNRLHKCPACSGSGAEAGTSAETCPDCRGTGQRVTVQRMGGMSFQSKTTCEKCRGTGKYIKTPCQKCRGSGLERETRKLTVTIPAGIDTLNSL